MKDRLNYCPLQSNAPPYLTDPACSFTCGLISLACKPTRCTHADMWTFIALQNAPFLFPHLFGPPAAQPSRGPTYTLGFPHTARNYLELKRGSFQEIPKIRSCYYNRKLSTHWIFLFFYCVFKSKPQQQFHSFLLSVNDWEAFLFLLFS